MKFQDRHGEQIHPYVGMKRICDWVDYINADCRNNRGGFYASDSKCLWAFRHMKHIRDMLRQYVRYQGKMIHKSQITFYEG